MAGKKSEKKHLRNSQSEVFPLGWNESDRCSNGSECFAWFGIDRIFVLDENPLRFESCC